MRLALHGMKSSASFGKWGKSIADNMAVISRAEALGYDAIWTPPPCKSPEAGTIKWGNVGYSLYDRFDLGEIPQRGTIDTRYGSRGDLRNLVDNLHFCDVKIYPDIIINHNGNGPDYRSYPGMLPNDFHIWQDASQPGGWKRPARMTSYDDINNGNGGTFKEELVSLLDIVTEPDARFTNGSPNFAAEPADSPLAGCRRSGR